MTFSYGADETAKELAAGLRDFFAGECDLERVRATWAEPGLDVELWSGVAGLGLTGALASEDAGGLGLAPEELVPAIEEIGYSGASLPLVDTLAVAIPVIERFGTEQQRAELLPGLVSGELVAATAVMAGGDRAMFAEDADVVLIEHDGALHVLRRGDYQVEQVGSPDPASRLGRIRVSSWQADTRLSEGAVEYASTQVVWAAAAFLNGVSRRMLDLTVDHAKTREQFGRSIGSFQAVKHLIADAWVATESSRPCAWFAATVSATGGAEATAAASVAKASASDAAIRVGDVALQVHGGIGFTWEHPLHFWMKRGKLLEGLHGSREFHARRLAAIVRDEPAWQHTIFAHDAFHEQDQ